MKLVSISGEPVTGKTTLWNDLRGHLDARADFVCDLPRQMLTVLGEDLAEAERGPFQHCVGFSQLIAERRQGDLPLRVLDKSMIDAIAYWDVLVGGARPAWARPKANPRYALALICRQEPGMVAQGELQEMHLGLRSALRARIEEIAEERADTVVIVSGDRPERLTLAVGELAGTFPLRARQDSNL